MNYSIKIMQNIRVEIVNNFNCKNTSSLLNFLNLIKKIAFKRSKAMNGLLIIAILKYLLHKFLDLKFLLLNHTIDDSFHPSKINIYIFSFLAFYILSSIQKIIFLFKFRP